MRKVIPIVPAFRQPAEGVLSEVVSLLSAFLSDGQTASIDLPSRGLTQDDACVLREQLGRGEVSAVIKALGESHIHETAYAGVWWLLHRDDEGNVISETIEITDCPQLLRSPREDIADSAARLKKNQNS